MRFLTSRAQKTRDRFRRGAKGNTMARQDNGQIVETATEARQGEPGPSVLALLTISTLAAIFVLAIVWFLFFRA